MGWNYTGVSKTGIIHACSTDDQFENIQYKKFIIKYYISSHVSQILSFDIRSNNVYLWKEQLIFFGTYSIYWNKMIDEVCLI